MPFCHFAIVHCCKSSITYFCHIFRFMRLQKSNTLKYPPITVKSPLVRLAVILRKAVTVVLPIATFWQAFCLCKISQQRVSLPLSELVWRGSVCCVTEDKSASELFFSSNRHLSPCSLSNPWFEGLDTIKPMDCLFAFCEWSSGESNIVPQRSGRKNKDATLISPI